MDLNIRCLALEPSHGLVQHDPGMGKREAFAFRACSEEQSSHACSLADAVRADIRFYILHGVVDRKP